MSKIESTREVRNGVSKPLRGLCLVVWEALDAATSEVTSKHVGDIAESLGIRPGYVGIVLAQHKAFNAGQKAAGKAVGKKAPATKKAAPAKAGKMTYSIEKGIQIKPGKVTLSEAAMRPGGAAA